ncbi:hypothetical protein AB0M87_13880 [Streptomyces sp. NPDC051320]|uniref:hypothetical protein n=1 Tax=Streptomyces sp. NPDC051320 TaxID=3154644 RepID=UPI00341E8861
MSVVEVISQADERGLAVSGLACLDRCVPLLCADDEVLRPLWTGLANGGRGWSEGLGSARSAPVCPGTAVDAGLVRAAELTRTMLDEAPADLLPYLEGTAGASARGPLYAWADSCSAAALEVHRILSGTCDATWSVTAAREDGAHGTAPLVVAELRRQKQILGLLSDPGPGALRRALDLTTEGRHVVRAVVSRRARARS